MSSSRILKCAMQEIQPVSEYIFETLQGDILPHLSDTGGVFKPIYTNNHGLANESAHQNTTGQGPEESVDESPVLGAEEMQQLLQEACDSGFAEGRREAEESFATVCRAFSESISAVHGLRERIIRECEDDLLKLAIMVAKQVIRQEISLDRKILAQFVNEATSGLTDQHDIIICFNPEDYRAVAANRQLYLAGISDKIQIVIKADETVSLGGCVVDTPIGLVDARVETQLAEIFKRLMQERWHGCSPLLELPAEDELYPTEQSGVENNDYQQD